MNDLSAFVNMAKKENYLICDTETTGLRAGEICQIAIIDAQGKTLLDTLVKTALTIPADATQIHHITNEMVENAPRWIDLTDSIIDLISGRDLVVYNAVYDRRMFHQSDELYMPTSLDWKTYARWWCAMEAYSEFYGDWSDWHQSYRWQKLTDAAYQQGIQIQDAHSALGDCLMTLEVVRKMVRTLEKQQTGK